MIDKIRHDAQWRDDVSSYLARRTVSTTPIRALIGEAGLPIVPTLERPIISPRDMSAPSIDAGLRAAVDAIATAAGVVENLNSQDRQMAINRNLRQSIQRLVEIFGHPSVVHQPTINAHFVSVLRSVSRAIDTSEPDGFASVTWSEIAHIRQYLDLLTSTLSHNSTSLAAALTENVNAIQSQVQAIATKIDHIESGWFGVSFAVDALVERVSKDIDTSSSCETLNARLAGIEERLSRIEQSIDK